MVESEAFRTRPSLQEFVGREGELAELRGALEEVRGGRGKVFLLVGDAGIGKTRLAEEISTAARAQGAQVVWGRCWEGGGAPAFWPWVQIFRSLAADLNDDLLREALADSAAQVASLAPDVTARVGVSPPASHAAAVESAHERFPLFDAVTGFLKRLAARRPLLLVVDDVHAADEPSLLLLEFVARELRAAPILVVGTYREVEAQRHSERARLLNAVARCGHRLPLAGLSQAEVARIVAAALPSGDEAAPRLSELAERVFRITEGNPFFVDEVVRLLRARPAAETDELLIPHGIREAVRGQLRPLSPECRHVLAAAAVIGREFDLTLLEEVMASGATAEPPSAETLLDRLGEAYLAGVVGRQAGALARYTFAHALIRETLYDDLPPGQRARLHWQIAEILERQSRDAANPPLAEMAHHYLRAAAVGDANKAVTYARRAGERAAELLAYEEAAACYQQALEALAVCRDPRPGVDDERVEALLALGEMQARAWNTTSAQQTFVRAADLARLQRKQRPQQAGMWLARAALGFGRTGIGVPRSHLADPVLVGLLEDALASLGDADPATRARVLARMAVEIYFSDSAAHRAALCEEASQLARRSGDAVTQAYVATAQHFASWDSPDVDWRLGVANEGVELARRAGEKDLEMVARLWRLLDLLEKGDVSRWEQELDDIEQVSLALRQPRPLSFSATLRAMRALWCGRFDEVEALWQKALAIGERAQDRAPTLNVAIQRFALMRLRGQQEALLPVVDAWIERQGDTPTLRCMRALLHADLGHEAEARDDFDRVAAADFDDMQRSNQLSMAILPWLSEVCSFLGDERRAASLYDVMLPYASHNAVGGPRLFFGPVEHWLGALAATRGHLDEAVSRLEDAAERSRAMDGLPALAATEYELARVLVRRNRPGDGERARQLLARVEAAGRQLGMPRLTEAAERLAPETDQTPTREPARATAEAGRASGAFAEASSGGRAPLGRVLHFPGKGGERPRPDAPTPTAERRQEYVFHREGEFWTVSDGNTVVRLKDTKGLRYIAQLLRHPDREFHVMDLIAPERDAAETSDAGLEGASEKELRRLGMHTASDAESGERLLDAQARTQYQRRLQDLREELDEATRFNDTERASRARVEMEFLAHELARAVGLGGRSREGSSGAERARLNVTRAVKAVLRRITAENANLGRYLETTIRTGAFCSYRPDPRLKVGWKL